MRFSIESFRRLLSSSIRSSREDQIAWAKNTLGLRPAETKTDADLRSHYYSMAKLCHPDVAPDHMKDGIKFGELSTAYSILISLSSEQSESSSRTGGGSTPTFKTSMDLFWAKSFFGDAETAELRGQGFQVSPVTRSSHVGGSSSSSSSSSSGKNGSTSVRRDAIEETFVQDLVEAASLSSGGLDKGGMWAFVHNLKQFREDNPEVKGKQEATQTQPQTQTLHQVSSEGGLDGDASNYSLPQPFTRKKRI